MRQNFPNAMLAETRERVRRAATFSHHGLRTRRAERGDVFERHIEHVVQHECNAFCGRQRIQHDQQSNADGIDENGFFLRSIAGSDCRNVSTRVIGRQFLAPAFAPFERIETNACNHRREPGFEICNSCKVGTADAQPTFLQRVVGFGSGSQYSLRDAQQAGASRLETLREPFRIFQRNNLPECPSHFTALDASYGWKENDILKDVSLIVYSTADVTTAKPFFRELIGDDPYADSPQYVGYKSGVMEVGLVPSGDKRDGGLAYWTVDDIAAKLKALVDAGGTVVQDVTDVGYGLHVATVKDPNGAIVGLRQFPKG